MGKPRDPDYWKKWRAAHPAYQARERKRSAQRDRSKEHLRRDYKAEYAKYRAPVAPDEPLPLLFPDLQKGAVISFWEDELRMDMRQEAFLALLEGRDQNEAIRQYARRELEWRHLVRYQLLADKEPSAD